MSEEVIVNNCSPTLAGLKTGSLFSYSYIDEAQMRSSLKKWNTLLVKKGMRIVPLKYKNNRALIYMYRPGKLCVDLQNCVACFILRQRGYCNLSPEMCVSELIGKLKDYDEFPHEIGLFLGYPPEDVSGFIENKEKCKLVGYWKVYGDLDNAKKLFAKFKKCTDVYRNKHAEGKTIEKLTVAT